MHLKIAICDDEQIILDDLSKRLSYEFKKYDIEVSITCYTKGEALLEDLESINYDAMFLDIVMPFVSGIEIAEYMRLQNPYTNIVFITNRDDLVFSSIKVKPFRFIRKLYMEEEIPEAVEALRYKVWKDNQYYVISFNNKRESIRIIDILYIESVKHDIYIYTNINNYRIKSNLSKIEEELEIHGFIRTHSGYLVNYRYIYSIDRTKIILVNKETIPVSRYRFEKVKEKLLWYSRGI